jgi:hypothetical protein
MGDEVFQTGPEAHPSSYTMGTGSFPGVKRPGRGVDHPPSSSAEVKEKVELYLYSPCGSSWPVIGGNLPLPLHTMELFTVTMQTNVVVIRLIHRLKFYQQI